MKKHAILLVLALAGCPGRVKAPAVFVAFPAEGADADCAKAPEEAAAGRIGAAVRLHGCGTDPQAMPLTYAWSLVSLPPGSRAALNSGALQSPSFVPDAAGAYRVRVVVSNGVLTAAGEGDIEVPACGVQAPAVTAIAQSPETPQTGEQVSLSTTIADADNDAACDAKQTFTHRWAIVRQPPGSTAGLNSATSATPSFMPDREGEYELQVVVTDSTGRASMPSRRTVTIGECGARIPAVTELVADPAQPTIGATVQLTPTVDDADTACTPADTHTYAWTLQEVPRGSTTRLNDAGVRQPSFLADVQGDYVVAVVATDAAGHASAPRTLTVTVSACGGAPPVVDAIAFAPAAPNTGAIVQASATITDADTDVACGRAEAFLFHWSIAAQPAGSAARLNNAAAESPSFVADLSGEYALRLVVTDASGRQSGPRVERVTVEACGGAAPEVAPTVSVATPRTGEIVQLEAAATDADADPLCAAHAPVFTYHWWFSQVPAGSFALLNDAGARNPSFVADEPGTYLLRVVATDPTGRVSAAGEVQVDAAGCGGAAPVVAPTAQPDPPNTGDVVALDAGATDADTDPACDAHPAVFTYRWWFAELPPGSSARLNDSGAARPSFTPDVPGDYVLRVEAKDPSGRTGEDEVTVSAQDCGSAAPEVTVDVTGGGTASPKTGALVQIEATVNDADTGLSCAAHAAVFAYNWSFVELPPGSRTALNDASSRNPSFVADVPGAYVLRASAADPTGRTGVADDFTVTAAACGSAAPAVTAVVSTGFSAAPAIGQTTQIEATVTDSDTDPSCAAHAAVFTYAWAFTELPAGSAARLNDAASRNPSFTPDVSSGATPYRLVVTATDPTGRSTRSSPLTVTASACGGNTPVGTISTNKSTLFVGEAVELTATGTDGDNLAACGLNQQLSYAWRLTELPMGSRAAINQPGARIASFTADAVGVYKVELVVTDSTGRRSLPSTQVISAPGCGAASPTVSVAATTVAPAVGQAVGLSATVTDTDLTDPSCTAHGPITAFSWRFDALPAGSRAVINDPTAFTPSFTPDVTGTYTLRLVATDPTGRSGTNTINITGQTCGTNAPTIGNTLANGLDPLTSVNSGTGVQLSATGVDDADNAGGACNLGQTLSYRWRLVEVPAGSSAQLSDTSAEKPTFIADVTGTFVAELVVTDSTGRSSAANRVNVVVTQCGSHRPTANIDKTGPSATGNCTGTGGTGTVSATLGQTVQLDAKGGLGTPLSSADADIGGSCGLNQSLFYTWTMLVTPSGSTASLSNRQAQNPFFTATPSGTFVVRLVVTDSTGLQSEAAECTINVP